MFFTRLDVCNTVAAAPFSLSAWVVSYPFDSSHASFSSSSNALNNVWGLGVNTLRVTSLDTATDSNTRERLPYGGDAYVGHAWRACCCFCLGQ